MKLKEFINQLIKEREIDVESKNPFDMSTFYGKEDLESIKEKILECDEFSECESLEILDYPNLLIDGKTSNAMSYKLNGGEKFKGKCYLLSLNLSPEIYDPKTINEIVKDGAGITPTLYKPENFEPYKKIVLQFSPDKKQDGITNHDAVLRQELHDLLDKIFDNPSDYAVKGERHPLVRGVFEEYQSGIDTQKRYFTKVSEDDTICTIYYFKKEEGKDGEIFMRLHTKKIPKVLREKYVEELGDKGVEVSEEEINEFLEKYK